MVVSGWERGVLCCPASALPGEVMRREPLGPKPRVLYHQGAGCGGDAGQDGRLRGLRMGSVVQRGWGDRAAVLSSCKR